MRESSWAFPYDNLDSDEDMEETEDSPPMLPQDHKPGAQDDTTTAFFDRQISPTQRNCDALATAITYLPHVTPLQHQGCHSYTVLCSSHPRDGGDAEELPGGSRPPHTQIVQFRAAEFMLDMQHVLLARKIHGGIVPDTRFHSVFNGKAARGATAPLHVYVMEHMAGLSVDVVKPGELVMRLDKEERTVRLMRDFARFTATTYQNPLPASHSYLAATQHSIESVLSSLICTSRITSPLARHLARVRASLSSLFNPPHLQVLTHNRLANPFSNNSILVDPHTGALTGIVGWHAASIRPFGLDLCALDAMLGTWDGGRDGRGGEWRWYANRRELEGVFWAELWGSVGIEEGKARRELEERIAVARAVGAVLAVVGKGVKRGEVGQGVVEVLEEWLGVD